MFTGDRIEERRDAALVVIETKVGCRQDRLVGVAFGQIGQDANQIARFLRLGCHQHLVFEKLQQMGCKRPCLDELALHPLMLGGWRIRQPTVFGDMCVDRAGDFRGRNLQAVLEQPMKQQASPVELGVRPFEVDQLGVNALDLLEGVGIAVAHRDHEHEKLRMLGGDLGNQLDEVVGPIAPGILLGVGETVVPGLELVEDECRGGVLEECEKKILAGDVGLLVSPLLPPALDAFAVWMPLKEQIPEELETLAVEAFADHLHSMAGRKLGQFRRAQSLTPIAQPLRNSGRFCQSMVEHSQQM